jgi:hypothetical protein
MNERLKTESDGVKKILEEKELCMKKIIDNLNSEKASSEYKYNRLINRKLTWKERIKGKIIIQEDEIKRI